VDWTIFWTLVETLSGLFYEPLLFWGVPLVPAVALEVWKRARVDFQ
jgi:hypothetical protein